MAESNYTASNWRVGGVTQKVYPQPITGLSVTDTNIAIVGYSNSSQTTNNGLLKQVRSRADVQSLYGLSILDLAMKKILEAKNLILADGGTPPNVYMVGVTPPVGPDVAMQATSTVTGTATVNGYLLVRLDDLTFRVATSPDDSVTDIAARIVSVVGEQINDLWLTLSNTLGVVTYVAREIGELGNDIYIEVDDTNAPGISVATTVSVVGTGFVSFASALGATLTSEVEFAHVVPLQSDSQTALDLLSNVQTGFLYTQDQPRGGIFPAKEDLANAVTEATAVDDLHVMVTCNEKLAGVGTPFHPESGRSMVTHMTAGFAALLSSKVGSVKPNEGPAYNFNRALIPGHARVNLSKSELNDALNGGVTVFVQQKNSALVWNPISTALTDQTGQTANPDKRWQPWEYHMTMWAMWQQLRVILSKYTKAPGTTRTLDSAKGDTLATLRQAASLGWVSQVDDDDVTTGYDSVTVPGFLLLIDEVRYTPNIGVDGVEVSHFVSTFTGA